MQKPIKGRVILTLFIMLGFGSFMHANPLPPSRDLSAGNEPLVFYLNGAEVQTVDKSPLADQISGAIPDQLVMKPGTYRFEGGNYALQKEGLYRFLLPGKMNLQRIVYATDIDSFLSAISWIHSHGNSDNTKSMEELTEKALQSKLLITCDVVSNWGNSVLATRDIKSRRVSSITLDQWNSYDDGHFLLEVWRNKWHKWVLYDLDCGSYFIKRQKGVPLSLLEFVKAVADKNYEIIHIASPSFDEGNFKSDGYDYAFIMESMFLNIRTWYERMMQIPLIYDEAEKRYYCYDTALRKRLELYDSHDPLDLALDYWKTSKFIPRTEFMNKFYPGIGSPPQ